MENFRSYGFCRGLALLVAATLSSGSCAALPIFAKGKQVGTLQTQLINEASGIVASRKSPGVLWVHNDSGDSPRVFAINAKGILLGIYQVEKAHLQDWEDIAIGPGPDPNQDYLYIGDIGDNRARRNSVIVYRVAEPKVDPNHPVEYAKTGPAEAIELEYPDGPKDAETLMVDPWNRDIYIISKRDLFSKVYRAAYPQYTKGKTTMVLVAVLPWGLAVGGDISPDGSLIIVRGPFNASIWQRAKGQELPQSFRGPEHKVSLLFEIQGEGICFDSRGQGFFTIGEGTSTAINYYPSWNHSGQSDN